MKIKFEGELAQFTRPEYKAEPHTYLTLTPTAAVGMLESIFWKPEIRYKINKIIVLKPIQTITMQRNMVESKQSSRVAKSWMQKEGIGHYYATSDRAQRNHVILKDVAYIVDFNFDLTVEGDNLSDKYSAQIKRRIERGQCYRQPYFGCREFPAFFSSPEQSDVPTSELKGVVALGLMPKELHFIPDSKGSIFWKSNGTFIKGKVVVEFAPLSMVDGVVTVC
jgi:CRISPR-associated protein Cas5d